MIYYHEGIKLETDNKVHYLYSGFWGNSIEISSASFEDINNLKLGTKFKIRGFGCGVNKDDYILVIPTTGRFLFKVGEVERCTNPNDLFFADIELVKMHERTDETDKEIAFELEPKELNNLFWNQEYDSHGFYIFNYSK